MRVGRFLKQLINPEDDQVEDRLEAVVSEVEDESSSAGINDDAPSRRTIATEEELREAGIDPAVLFADENRKELVSQGPEPEQEPEPGPEPQPEPEHLLDSEPGPEKKPVPEPGVPFDSGDQSGQEHQEQVASIQQSGPEDTLPEPASGPTPEVEPGTEPEFELPAARRRVVDEFSLAELAVNSGFIITLAHELRTPIASLRVSYDLLKDPETVKDNPGESRRLLGNIDRSIAKLERQASDLLEVGYLRSGSMSLVKQPLNLTEPLLEAIEISRPAAAQRHIAIELEFPPDQPSVIADGYRLTQVMTHLLSNAIKFTPVQGSVLVTVEAGNSSAVSGGAGPEDSGTGDENRQDTEEPAPDVLIVRVTDPGPGIREAHSELIFEPFYRISGEGIEGGAGVGLGLAIVKGLVELHEGSVWVKSTPGETTEFGFSVPIG